MKVIFVPIGNVFVEYETLKRYFLHSFKEHKGDIMGWDLLRTQLHKYLTLSIRDEDCWSDKAHEALSKLMDEAFSCPTCHKVPMYNSNWFCMACKYQVTTKNVMSVLENLRRTKEIEGEV
jgi:hypothetical protein